DGKRLAYFSGDKAIQVWDLNARQLCLTLNGRSQAFRVAFTPDGRHLASFSEDGTFELWDAATGKPVGSLKKPAGTFAGAIFSPDSKRLASWGAGDKAIRVWDLTKGRELHFFQGHTDAVACATFSPDGRYLASGSHDKTVKIWDTTTSPNPQTL